MVRFLFSGREGRNSGRGLMGPPGTPGIPGTPGTPGQTGQKGMLLSRYKGTCNYTATCKARKKNFVQLKTLQNSFAQYYLSNSESFSMMK